jgi:pimeloyl-ACP methyl ester carboxylesterase
VGKLRGDGLEFEYDTFGDPGGAPLLLVAGLGAQMISWDDGLCRLLAERGFRVIRFDNRDVGLSTRLDHLGTPDVWEVVGGRQQAPYTLQDMAVDAASVLDALGVPAAHVAGVSMGGFIVQQLAIDHPEKVLSLTSIMSAPGGLAQNAPGTPEASEALVRPPPDDREGMIEHGVWIDSVIHGPLFDEDYVRRRRTLAVDRAVSVAGTRRQLAAVAAAGSRVEQLGRLSVPALVIHGEADPLVPIENGRRTAEAIPGARLMVLAQMGHDLPMALWPEIVDAIAETARRADTRVPATA